MFAKDSSQNIEGVTSGSIATNDVDNDGDLDLILMGAAQSQIVARLYKNDGGGNFSLYDDQNIDATRDGSICFEDVDNDGNVDLLVTGRNARYQIIADLYMNDGMGNYSKMVNTPFIGVTNSSIDFADIDGDLDNDLLITGLRGSTDHSELYLNNSGNFVRVLNTVFDNVSSGSGSFLDVDSDNDQDLLITGRNENYDVVAKFYLNDGNASYTESGTNTIGGVRFSAVGILDIDVDGDMDILLTGRDIYGVKTSNLYRNTTNELQWTGDVNSSWSNAANWSSNTIPVSTDKIIIPDVSNPPLIESSNNVEFDYALIKPFAQLNVAGDLKVNGNIANSGTLTFKSDATSTGQLDEFNGKILGSGTTTVERFIPSDRGFRFMSAPLNSASSIKENWQEGVNNVLPEYSSNQDPNPGYGIHITGSTTGANGFDASISGNPSLFGFDNAAQTWFALDNTDVKTLVAGEPLRLMVRGSRAVDLSQSGAISSATRIKMTGDLHTGDMSTNNLSNAAGGYSFVGNPYQSSIDMIQVLNSAINIDTSEYYTFDPVIGTQGAYVTYDPILGAVPNTSTTNQYLQPHQAFFVSTLTDGPATINFTESIKATGDNTQTFITPSTLPVLRVSLLQDASVDSILLDQTLIAFDSSYSSSIDSDDAYKFMNIGENIAVNISGSNLSISKQAYPLDGEQVNLYINNNSLNDYKLSIELPYIAGKPAHLIDNSQGSIIPLSQGLNSISFTAVTGVDLSSRFQIKFMNQTLGNDDFANAMFEIYPNPANHTVTLASAVLIEEYTIYNTLGAAIISNKLTAPELTQIIDVTNLDSGIYFITVKSSTQFVTKKLVKN